ncbi:hypothetical protein [Patiriisocius sp. Uisw_047]|jgi:hypothetical protein|uniref:hypothetical protein n=1 Tax=Patiriisocius sp. Uisw_047 TaxID=3230969 RepID=UPI0039E75299
MRIRQRFVFYGIGFIIGLILLFFFLGGKRTSCDYGPNSRVLKNIRIKERVFSETTIQKLTSHQLDTSSISTLLRKGNVLFSESTRGLDSCKVYIIQGTSMKKELKMTVKNCDSIATVQRVEVIY